VRSGFSESKAFRFSFVLPEKRKYKMVRGGSSGGGQSSLGYLFGPTETAQPKPVGRAAVQPPQPTVAEQRPAGLARNPPPEEKPALAPVKAGEDSGTSLDMGGQKKMGRNSNNYHRADGQNTGNFITVSFPILLLELHVNPNSIMCSAALSLSAQTPDNVAGHNLAILSAVSF
jgi:SPIRAL1-like protein